MQVFLSEYVGNSITHALHVEGFLHFAIPTTTNLTSKLVGNQIFDFFDPEMPCKYYF